MQEKSNLFDKKTFTNNLNSVNKKISELIEISLSDFLYLNNLIKEFNNQISKTNSLYNKTLEQLINDQYIIKINTILKIIRQQKRNFYHFIIEINKLIKTLNETNKISEKLYYNLYSIYNDICTIKILLVDYYLCNNKDKEIISLYENINNLSNTLNESINILAIRKDFITNSLKNIEKFNNTKNKADIKEKFSYIALYLYLLLKANHKISKIKKSLDEKTKNIEEIINNTIIQLQYQDIVRQKFEHVNIVHEEIIQKLSSFTKKQNTKKYIENISDIIYLEAAQIMHANNLYINALKNILNNIWKINEVTENLCNDYKKINKNLEFFSLENFNNLRKYLTRVNNLISNNIKIFENTINIIQHNNNAFNEEFKLLSSKINSCYTLINEIKPFIKNSNENILSKTFNILENIKSQFDESSNISKTLNKQITNDLSNDTKNSLIRNLISNSTELKLQIYDLIITFKDIDIKIKQIISNQFINNQISLEGIRYYKNFDKEINDILKKLIELGKNFKNSNLLQFDNPIIKRKTLERIKNVYTIKSEYLIHEDFERLLDKLDDNGNENIFYLIENKNINESNGDVELF